MPDIQSSLSECLPLADQSVRTESHRIGVDRAMFFWKNKSNTSMDLPSRALSVQRTGRSRLRTESNRIMLAQQLEESGNNGRSCGNNNGSSKDVRLLLLPETSSDGNPTPVTVRAPLQKILIDDLTKAGDAGLKRRQLLVWRVPWFILLMCFMQISLHLIANECMKRRLIYKPEWSGEYWRLLTYMLLHADVWHLTLNICLQCFIGVCLELEQGHCRLAVVYIAGGAAGSLFSAWLQPHLLLVGASAGVYAMLGSHVPHLVLNFSQLSHRFSRIAALLILFLSDVGFTTFHFRHNQNRNPRISLEAHMGGGVAGLLCGFIVYRRIRERN